MKMRFDHRGTYDLGTAKVDVHLAGRDVEFEGISILNQEGLELALMARLVRGDVQILLHPEQEGRGAVASGDWEVNFPDDPAFSDGSAGRVLCIAPDQQAQSELATEVAAGAILAIIRRLGPDAAQVG